MGECQSQVHVDAFCVEMNSKLVGMAFESLKDSCCIICSVGQAQIVATVVSGSRVNKVIRIDVTKFERVYLPPLVDFMFISFYFVYDLKILS